MQLLKVKVPGTKARRLYKVLEAGSYNVVDHQNIITPGHDEIASIAEAHVVSSLSPSGAHHRPVLDLDIPATLVPSSTPGHSHLYLDVDVTWAQYMMLLAALAAAGIIEQGYVKTSIQRGYTCVRLPWIRKGQ